MYILTCSSALTRVSSGELLLESDERPELPFAFDALYLEEPTNLAFKVLAGEQIPLAPDEIAACTAFCDNFLETADYTVSAYDDAGVFAGSIRKSEAVQRGLAFTFPNAPDHPAAKWTGEAWERIEASILDDGTLTLKPEGVCARCTLALTAAEWAAFPKPPAAQEDEDWKWDFADESWRDVADPLVFAFDEADAFVGQHPRSMAAARGWGWRKTPPDGWPYKNTPDGWQRVEAVIYENGDYERLPGGIRDDAMLLFTREEWAAWPARPGSAHGELWRWNFRTEAWEDVSDPYGCAFETGNMEQSGLYAGDMLRSEAGAGGLGFTRERPAHPVSKWDGAQWQRVAVVFMDDGTVREQPDTLCSRCMLPLTAGEWGAWPRPAREIPPQFGEWSWNFAAETWEDRRDPERLRILLTTEVYQRHLQGQEALLPDPFALNELALAVDELRRRKADPSAPTPFVDARYPDVLKESLELDLSAQFTRLAAARGRLAAERAALLAEVAACADNPALDALFVRLRSERTAPEAQGTSPCSRA